jgi:hypothetical protein
MQAEFNGTKFSSLPAFFLSKFQQLSLWQVQQQRTMALQRRGKNKVTKEEYHFSQTLACQMQIAAYYP